MKYWLFQGNPDQFDIDVYLQKTKKIYWSVSVKKYQQEISIGDIVFLWRAQGKNKAISGVVAKSTVIEECKLKNKLNNPINLYDELWMPESVEKSEYKVGLLVETFRLQPINNMLTAQDFKADPILKESRIIKVRVGSNFSLSQDEAQRINDLWSSSELILYDEYEGKEGKILYKIHRIRERDNDLRPQYINDYLKKHTKLQCELCRFSPQQIYKNLGENILEIHHTVPLCKLPEMTKTKLSDLILLCPNCHRALHKGNAEKNLNILKKIFQQRRCT